MEGLLDILQWAFPTGVSIVNLALLGTIWRKNRARLVADTRDTWQSIAESNNDALLKQNDEIRNLREALKRLEVVIQNLLGCPHWPTCPARILVQDYKQKYFSKPNRQPRMAQKGQRYPRDNPDIAGGDVDSGGQPP